MPIKITKLSLDAAKLLRAHLTDAVCMFGAVRRLQEVGKHRQLVKYKASDNTKKSQHIRVRLVRGAVLVRW